MHLQELIQTIKDRRDVLGITQADLAELAGISLRTLTKLEAGKGNPTMETLMKIADVLGLELRLEVKHPKI